MASESCGLAPTQQVIYETINPLVISSSKNKLSTTGAKQMWPRIFWQITNVFLNPMGVRGSAGKRVENTPFASRRDGHSGAKLSLPSLYGGGYGCLRRFALVPCQMILCVTVDPIVEVTTDLVFPFLAVLVLQSFGGRRSIAVSSYCYCRYGFVLYRESRGAAFHFNLWVWPFWFRVLVCYMYACVFLLEIRSEFIFGMCQIVIWNCYDSVVWKRSSGNIEAKNHAFAENYLLAWAVTRICHKNILFFYDSEWEYFYKSLFHF